MSPESNLTLSVLLGYDHDLPWIDCRAVCVLFTPERIFVGNDDGSITIWLIQDDHIELCCISRSPSNFPVVDLVSFKLSSNAIPMIASIQSDGTFATLSANGSMFLSVSPKLLVGVGIARASTVFGGGRYLAVTGQSVSILIMDLITMSPTHLLHGSKIRE